MELLTTNNVWMMICTALVFFMHLGFSLLEIGLTRQKNTINILFKNIFIITVGLLLYCLVGFNLMYPGFAEGSYGIFGFSGFGLSSPMVDGALDLSYNGGYTYWTDFLFQGMFAATAATIVSGAVAERVKIVPFMIFTVFYVGLVYPIAGSWKWGGGFLQTLETPFYDFAGSTLVHSVGGWAALVAVWLLGARIGKFKNGKAQAIPGHNLPLATAGVLILWLGWFGFNGGSVLSADPALTSLTLVTTCLAAASGGVVAMLVSSAMYKNLDLTMFLNGILGGLVGITAGADQMSPTDAILVGSIAGILIVFAVACVDKIKLDDPVGAIAVHLICGIWGTLAVGIFGALAGMNQFISQLIGVASYAAFCIIASFIILFILKKTVGIRVSEKEEVEGLDSHEHGMDAYPDFRLNEH
ncbi:MAG: ammonium transporter [Flavobacteriales bacterium]|nr:ammonium transporter [Flavobacteriia bacterium]NCP05325.1 ammonium transporter [Flavobacteriales bacterium]PIQ18930.1 MAG: ammonium transporter [Flavobacteriaceae bacterium CG18_big_fil_WC_8_21_14_2_50_34_36]PIV93888.1 MAG: ammonium transporter [Flavobacteriaceae bacterium CG17_big_fil_post_rev_8_21_14_2_50_33_15]PIY13146.1 MAG: ammonium transporter [Flavobacteriaceae bacterium CG_4_10_14_3_um_filter_33_47]PJB18916.1 MAG: ammonium transporter [Flavobacteriaceae bacterium CG_4_9_14_3_um_filt